MEQDERIELYKKCYNAILDFSLRDIRFSEFATRIHDYSHELAEVDPEGWKPIMNERELQEISNARIASSDDPDQADRLLLGNNASDSLKESVLSEVKNLLKYFVAYMAEAKVWAGIGVNKANEIFEWLGNSIEKHSNKLFGLSPSTPKLQRHEKDDGPNPP